MSSRPKKAIRIIGERNINLHLSNPSHRERITKIAKALSSPIRLQILDMLKNTPRSLQEIASILDIPVSSTALHIQKLEDAALIVTETQPGLHGSMRVCICSMQSLHLETFDSEVDSVNRTATLEMPIGNYFNCDVTPTCGLANEKGPIGSYDSATAFFAPNRTSAQLIWFNQGYLEYRFPNICNPLLTISELSFSMELCSEAPGFMENWPSDIIVSVNNHKIGTFHSPGDFGGRRGKLTPATWANGNTQYGILKTFSVQKQGSYLDGQLEYPDLTLDQLHLNDLPYISLKISVEDTPQNGGGINLFGELYGDYPQGIVMSITYL